MHYPNYPSQPYSGNLLTMKEMGPPDMLPTSLTAPHYQAPIDRRYGRALAGSSVEVQDETAAENNAFDTDNLERLRELDDVQGDGIFDPPGTHPNIYPDAGVFAARYSLPGYHVREIPFKYSEVRDATTGRPIVPVPNGAVSLDTPAKLAQLERHLYAPAQPVVWSNRGGRVRDQWIADVVQNPEPVLSGFGRFGADAAVAPAPSSSTKTAVAVIGLGLAAGALYALLSK